MKWEECEFVLKQPGDKKTPGSVWLTGWEGIVFEVEDDSDGYLVSSD